jgi:integrase
VRQARRSAAPNRRRATLASVEFEAISVKGLLRLIIVNDGFHAMKISPEAGTTKTGKARTVPLHEHLIKHGFLAFVKANGKGPLFYNEQIQIAAPDDPTNPRKPRYVKARERVAAWVRNLGVNDPELSPNHAWRHTSKAVGFRSGISERVLDAIVGHAPASVGRGYGEPTLSDKAKELRKFADINYLRKQAALFNEFRETGMSNKLNYNSVADLRTNF